MRVQDRHAHASSSYATIRLYDYVQLFCDVCEVKARSYKSLTVHLPFEIQHPHIYKNLGNGLRFIAFGEFLKKIFVIKLYWENAPEEVIGVWSLKYGQTQWDFVPKTIALCLDVGHLMIGSRTVGETRKKILAMIKIRGKQINHFHIHENDFIHDLHHPPKRVLSQDFLKRIVKNRTYIIEKGA